MPKLDIDTDYIEKLADIISRTGLTEIELSHGDIKIRVARQVQMVVEAAMPRATAPGAYETAPAAAAAPAAPAPTNDASHPGAVTSPMVGTVYLCPEPGAPSFVNVGDDVREGQTLLIIEAMKVMNAIRSPRSGKVTRIIVQNAAPVEYGEPLMIIE
ncbi:MAG: acetyl-CoA carboxylase biotin carboxyl carrier protein [Geminicoccaceae bacterium]